MEMDSDGAGALPVAALEGATRSKLWPPHEPRAQNINAMRSSMLLFVSTFTFPCTFTGIRKGEKKQISFHILTRDSKI